MKIAIVLKGFYIGGTEKVLINMLNRIDLKEHEVTLFLYDKENEFLDHLPKEVKVHYITLPKEGSINLLKGSKRVIKDYLKKLKVISATKVFFKKLKHDPLAELTYSFNKVEKENDVFDIAISYYLQDTMVTAYVAEKIIAKRKYAWIHNDFLSVNYHAPMLYQYLDKFDEIFTVSNSLKKEAETIYKKYYQNFSVFHNFSDIETIIEKSMEYNPYDNKESFHIVSVGRLSEQKGFDMAIRVSSRLKKDNLNFKWYIIGDGVLRDDLKNSVDALELNDSVILTGAIKNPYPYIKNANLYVQPSRHEGYCTATLEAKVLEKIVITTNVSGANEQFTHNVDGLIVDIDENAIYLMIKDVIENYEKYQQMIRTTKNDIHNINKLPQEKLEYIMNEE